MDKSEQVSMAVEVIIDNSGSMQCIKAETVKGINEFIAQLASGIQPAYVSVTLFDDVLRKTIIDHVSVAEAPRVREHEYDPHHGTENIAHSVIQALDKRLAPRNALQKVLVVQTDGLNRSPQMEAAKKLIAKRQSEGWLIIWLGVYSEYMAEYKQMLLDYAKGLGIPEGVTFALKAANIGKGIPLAAQAALRFAGTGDATKAAFTAKERGLID